MFKDKWIKRAGLGLATVALVIAGAAAFSAFEAHVINVTARIENALRVDTSFIEFGTVFPQEELEHPVQIALSDSFIEEDRVDDVNYFIRQKPKCAITSRDGTQADLTVGQDGTHAYTGTGHVVIGDNPATQDVEETSWIDCGVPPRELTQGETWGVLPDLCPYISKDGRDEDGQSQENDSYTPSFHSSYEIVNDTIQWLDTPGKLIKSFGDTVDNWIIDLKVPCFGGFCAQDWANFVQSTNPGTDPNNYTQPIANEHKVFGCDLWVEVGGVSLSDRGGLCSEEADIMLVLDRSGSIGGDMPTLKAAADAFVDALALDGVHAGMTSFSTAASLDVHLTNVAADLHTAIGLLVADGTTDLEDGILTGTLELSNPGDGHDRPDGTSPDVMVIITDGEPNECNDFPCDPEDAAAAAADAARAAGIEVFVVGVGDGASGPLATYLATEIADDAGHFFSAEDFEDLEAILEDLANCPELPI